MCNDQDYRYNIIRAHQERCAVLPNGNMFSLNTRETRLNNNIAVIGTSGSNKTRSTVTTNILSATGSYIVADPKGSLYKRLAVYMKGYGYRVRRLSFIHPERSDCYNPLAYLRCTDDYLKLAHMIVYSGGKGSLSADPFWDKADEMLLSALIAYIAEGGCPPGEQNFHSLITLATKMDPEMIENGEECALDRFMNQHMIRIESKGGSSWAYQQYRKFRKTPSKTMGSILITLQTALSALDTNELRKMMRCDMLDIPSMGSRPTIVFVEVSDTDRSKDLLANLFYTQAMNELCSFADEQPDSRLPVPVRFILDDFGTNCRIEGFENMISNIRSREISAMLILQSESQLVSGYGDCSHTILDNCDTLIYTGGNDIETANMIAQRSGRSLRQILTMPVCTNWVFRRGEEPCFSETHDLSEYFLRAPNIVRVNQAEQSPQTI